MTGRDGVYVLVARLWLVLTLIGVAANVLALTLLAARSRPSQGAPALEDALHRSAPHIEAATLARETPREFVHQFFTQFRERPTTGRYVNVDPAGFRQGSAVHPWPPEDGHRNVFLFGGSTVFGYGAADDQTLGSALERRLAGAERAIRRASTTSAAAAISPSSSACSSSTWLPAARAPSSPFSSTGPTSSSSPKAAPRSPRCSSVRRGGNGLTACGSAISRS